MDATDRTRLRQTLAAMGVGRDVADLVTVGTTPGIGDAPPRGLVTIAFRHAGRTTETAIVSTETADGAWTLVGSPDEILPLIARGVRAMPAARRPALPNHVAAHPGVASARRDRERARRLARAAADEAEAPFGAPCGPSRSDA